MQDDQFGNPGSGPPTNEARGAIDATASYLTFMNGAAKMSDKDFEKGLAAYDKQHFQQNLPK